MTRSRVDPLPSSEAEICSVGLRGVRMGHMLGFIESFPFFRIWKEAGGLRGPSCLNMCFVFLKVVFSTTIRVSLIVVPDSSPRGFGRVRGFGQRVFQRFFPFDVISQCMRIRQTRLSASPADATTRRSG